MYAVVETGGKQYRVAPGDVIEVEKLERAPGEDITLDRVLLVSNDTGIKVGTPLVEGARVLASVEDQIKGPKLIVFKMKPKTRYRVKTGHRQKLTRLVIKDIVA